MIASPWPSLVTSLLGAFLTFYIVSFGLFHLMIYGVNRGLSVGEKIKIPHSLYFGRWNRLRDLYKGFYPRSSLYSVTLSLAVACGAFAVAATVVLFWQFAVGK